LTPDLVVSAARSHLGTAYHHQGRLPGVGLDCVGLVIVVAKTMGKTTSDVVYPDWPQPNRMLQWFERDNHSVFEQVDGIKRPGDIYTFWWTRSDTLWHVAIATPVGILHVSRSVGKVVEMPLTRNWVKRMGPVFRFRE
jgi:cell wall-associated NlpC family hydrolase